MSTHLTRISTIALAGLAAVSLGVGSTLASGGAKKWAPKTGAAYAAWTKSSGLNGKSARWAADVDRDGLRNWGEFRSGTNPRDVDSDDDSVNDLLEDGDHDGLTNGVEYRLRTNPRRSDDLGEIRQGEIEVKGTVQSFLAPTATTAGVLSFTLGNGASTLDIPAGATLSGSDLLVPGAFVEVEIERDGTATIVKVKSEDDDERSTGSGGDDRGGKSGSGRGGDHRDDGRSGSGSGHDD